MKLKELLLGVSYEFICGEINKDITGISEDSRRIKKGDFFFCRESDSCRRRNYVIQAFDSGAEAAAIDHAEDWEKKLFELKGYTVIEINHKNASSFIASNFYGYPQDEIRIIGVTGTKGKTTTCCLISEFLNRGGISCALCTTNGITVGNEKSDNAHTTPVQFEIYRFLKKAQESGCRYCVIEVSSLSVKQGRTDGIQFWIGIFTNLSPDHIGGKEHSSYEEYSSWKAAFFDSCDRCLLNADDSFSEVIQERCGNRPVYLYSIEKEADAAAYGIRTEKTKDGFLTVFSWKNSIFRTVCEYLKISLPGRCNVSNAAAAIFTYELAGGCLDRIKAQIADITVEGRFQYAGTCRGAAVIIDYAHNEISLETVLDTLSEYKDGRLICMFGCGGERSVLRRVGMAEVSCRYADMTVITQDNSRNESFENILNDILKGIDRNADYRIIKDRKEAIEFCLDNAEPGDIILLAGKGHEKNMIIEGKTEEFSEAEIVRSYIKRMTDRQSERNRNEKYQN